MVFSFTTTTQRLQEVADGTRININRLVYTWRVRMKGEESIKEEVGNEREGLEKKKKNTVAIKNQTCNQTCEKYIRTNLLGPCR